ncbi:MAG: 23S rRNA (pseudouridine(1915)-N(3))-methyltransferase RlmH [Clostridia bacterium]|nr:23S rRNA (pseudouridine(1915)-N(3))-methyltransferase RlmH [Clostridia bacterium]
MTTITVITVGKIKEKYFTDAIKEYQKRLSRYCKLCLIEVPDEPTPDSPSPREKEQVLEKEGDRILKKIPDSAHVTALCIEGTQMSSEKLAENLDTLASSGVSHRVFIIGGSMGLSDAVKARANLKLSFSPMTFPHQLMRVILLEQIYRAFTISAGTKYHK